jgi:hypothetical protein
MPELIFHQNNCINIYTIINGEAVLCTGSNDDSRIYISNSGGIVIYFSRMKTYEISKITLYGTTLNAQTIALDSCPADESYPDLSEFGLG